MVSEVSAMEVARTTFRPPVPGRIAQLAYFGDYNILHNLKSNLVFKTLSGERPTDELEEKKKLENLDNKDESAIKSRLTEKEKVFDKLPETIFMCINK